MAQPAYRGEMFVQTNAVAFRGIVKAERRGQRSFRHGVAELAAGAIDLDEFYQRDHVMVSADSTESSMRH